MKNSGHKLKIIVLSIIKKMIIKELKDFIFQNYHQQMGFAKENIYYSIKHLEKKFTIVYNCINKKIPDPSNLVMLKNMNAINDL